MLSSAIKNIIMKLMNKIAIKNIIMKLMKTQTTFETSTTRVGLNLISGLRLPTILVTTW